MEEPQCNGAGEMPGKEGQDSYNEDDEEGFEKPYINEDAAYERYRDNAGEKLEDELKDLLNKFWVESGYYHNCEDKIRQHAICIIEAWKR